MRGVHRASAHPAVEPIIGGMDTPPPFDPSVTAHPDPEETLSGPPEPWDFLPQPVPRDGPPWWMTEMIAAEPALAGRVLRRLGVVRRSSGVPGVPARLEAPGRETPAGRLATAIRSALEKGAPVVVTGCGTSEHGAQAFAAIVADAAARAGIRGAWQPGSVLAAQAFEAALAPQRGGLIVGISHEGGTGATIAALEAAAAAGARTAAVTVHPASPIGRFGIVLATGEIDRSWCHTVGYLSPILAAVAVGAALTGVPGDADPLAGRALLEAGVAQGAAAEAIAAELAGMREVIVVASGADRPAGRELALKIEEATWLPTTMRDLETFLHGHLPSMDEQTGVVLILADRAGRAARSARAQQAMAAAGRVGVRAAGILAAELDADWPAFLVPAGRILVPARPARPVAALVGSATPLHGDGRLAAPAADPDPIRRDSSPRGCHARGVAAGRAWRRPGATAPRAGDRLGADQHLAEQVDHLEVPGQEVLQHEPLGAGGDIPPGHGPGFVRRADDP
jgi:fructoselysine-6-P-deglycase FrlB-like protein